MHDDTATMAATSTPTGRGNSATSTTEPGACSPGFASLGDTLAALDDWDGDLDWLAGVVDEWQSSLPPPHANDDDADIDHTAQASVSTDTHRPRRNNSRNRKDGYTGRTHCTRKGTVARRREEIQQLKATAATLQRELSAAHQRREMCVSNTLTNAHRAELLTVWEEIATRQANARYLAEQKNRTLRALLTNEALFAPELVRVGKTLEVLPRVMPPANAHGSAHRARRQLPTLPHEQVRSMEKLYAQMETVFATGGAFQRADRMGARHVDIQDDGCGGAVIVVRATWVVPFEAEQVARVMWQHPIDMAAKEDRVEHYVGDDTIVLDAIQTLPLQHHEDACLGKVVARRYRDKRGSAVVTSVVKPPMADTPTCFPNCIVRGEEWLQVVPHVQENPQSMPPAVSPLSRVQWCRHVHITMLTDHKASFRTPPQEPTIDAITGILVPLLSDDVRMKQQLVETRLLLPSSLRRH